MAQTSAQSFTSHTAERRRDRWVALGILVFCWILFASIEQSPFKLQGAVVEALVERGRLHFVRGNINGIVFENLDTNTPSFRYLFNIFPHGGLYHVNHAPGQFFLAAPWYAACVELGWRFETHERLVWRVLVWTLTAPLGAWGVMCVFILARCWSMPFMAALLATTAFALASPWWAASGVLYHDSLAIALVLIGTTLWQYRRNGRQMNSILAPIAAGFLLAFSVVTTYLVVPIVLTIIVFLLAARPARRDVILFALAFVPTLALLPIANTMAFGSLFATGYSAGGFDTNYPSPFDFVNAWEKTGFYLWHSDYGLLGLFPIFFCGAVGLIIGPSITPAARKLLVTLMAVHFLFIISMEHHGSVGWGMGRFFLPLFPILAFGLPALWDIKGSKGHAVRALLFAALLWSGVFALAAASYGVQGVMEPGLPTLKLRLMFDHSQLFKGLFWLTMIGGILAELLYQAWPPGKGSLSPNPSRPSRQGISPGSKVILTARARRRRRRK